jgi:hypothetical protein
VWFRPRKRKARRIIYFRLGNGDNHDIVASARKQQQGARTTAFASVHQKKRVYDAWGHHPSLDDTFFFYLLICFNCPQVCFKNNPRIKSDEKHHQVTASFVDGPGLHRSY